MKILALDVATHLGWAYSEKGETVNESGIWDFTVKKDESTGLRLLRLKQKLEKIRADKGVDLIVFENTVHQIGARGGAHVQAEMQGVVKLFCEEHKIEFKGFFPPEIKKHATGKGNAKKEQMVDAAVAKWKKAFDYNQHDEVDARWILDLAIHRLTT